MRRSRTMLLAAALTMTAAVPALAAWDRIGSIAISPGDRVTTYREFGGRMESLNFTARDSDVECRDVTATFGNGATRSVFRGFLERGRPLTVDLPGRERMVTNLTFDCHAQDYPGATLDIAADIGRYRADWRASPDWQRVWARRLNWADDDRLADSSSVDRHVEVDRFANRDVDRRVEVNRYQNSDGSVVVDRRVEERRGVPADAEAAMDWTRLGSRSFTGQFGRDAALTMAAGDVTTIGLRPRFDDARCNSVTATFRNGETRTLDIGNGDLLRADWITELDVPGGSRDVMRVDMSCHAEHGDNVTIEVLTAS
jgi:hypothetical protein